MGEAGRTGASLHLVSAWIFPMAPGYAFTATVHDMRQAALDTIERALSRVSELAPGLEVRSETPEQVPGPALVAASNGADLLVVGSRGRGGFEGLLLGSVSKYCASHATCSVVVVR